ncbi:hypothetical protein K402DRAFT_308175, partial [Aulographum hederae CBS 113979]
MDTGGLAQMSYNNFSANGGLGLAGPGYASRGKGSQLKRLNVASPPSIGSISENQVDNGGTPRTSRSHLLAGLRTAARAQAAPSSAPYGQSQHQYGVDASKYAGQYNTAYNNQAVPHTATGASFPSAQQYAMSAGQQYYALPEQVLAPPSINYGTEEELDPEFASRLQATQLYLAQRQQQLVEQLRQNSLQQQLQGMHLNGSGMRQSPTPQTPVTPQTSYYSQQLQSGAAPIPQEVPGQPGLYVVFNPLTGQYTYAMDSSAQQTQLANSPPPPTPSHTSFNAGTPTFRASVSPPLEFSSSPFGSRSISPPKKTPSPPSDVTPLPPPSANAFRRGHKKAVSSLAFDTPANNKVGDGPKSAFTRPVGFPATPMTGTFGPGQARAGEHPERQPHGPPPLEELVAKPTTKHEGSKNFVRRESKQLAKTLKRFGLERTGRNGSTGSMTPVSEADITFSLPSDNDSDSGRSGSGSGSLSRRPSIGSLRAAANGAIGSERRQSKER